MYSRIHAVPAKRRALFLFRRAEAAVWEAYFELRLSRPLPPGQTAFTVTSTCPAAVNDNFFYIVVMTDTGQARRFLGLGSYFTPILDEEYGIIWYFPAKIGVKQVLGRPWKLFLGLFEAFRDDLDRCRMPR